MIPVRQSIGGLGNLMFKQAYIYAQMRDGVIPDIYLQDAKYWASYADEIKKMFGQGIGKDDRISLHIRRGDYLEKDGFYTDLWKTGYYKKAIELFPEERFLVFYKDRQGKDDLDFVWCEENLRPLLGKRMDYHKHGEETDDLNAMASCKSNILANSSFSYWCGILNPNPDKKVVCPIETKYYADGIVRTKWPKEFIQLDF